MFEGIRKIRFGIVALCCAATACAVEPTPISPEDRADRAAADLTLISSMDYVPEGPITLHAAMARAVAFNLQRRVREIEREIEDAELRTRNYEMLPELDVKGSYSGSSEQLSNSDDRIERTASATLTWNVLDLGVSYARAKQAADETMIARERERKALQDIIRQVRAAYWRAAGAQRLMDRVQKIARHIRIAMRESRAMERSGGNDVIKSVAYRREIVDSVRQALTVQRELREARAELAELLNIRPGVEFELADTPMSASMPALPMSLEEMEQHALDNRPELRVEDYNERMSVWQAREAMVDMLPLPRLSIGPSYSSNSANLAPNWIATGMQLGMNLFSLFSGSSRIDEADTRGELARSQRLAMTLAVMTQTHIAYIQFRNAAQQTRLAREVSLADRRLAQLVASDTDFMNTDYFEAVRYAARQLQSEMEEHTAQVELVTAHSDVIHAIGLDVFPDDIRIDDLAGLTDQIALISARWEQKGEIEPSTDTPLDQLVNAMLRGGEAANSTPVDAMPRIEVKLDEPPENAVAGLGLPADEDAPAGPAEQDAFGGARMLTVAAVPRPRPKPPLPAPVPKSRPEIAAAESPRPPEASPAAGPRHVVQLGVFSTVPRAERLRRSLTGPADAALHGVELRIVERPARDGKTLHYVETAAIPDETLAQELCATLKGLGRDCYAVTH